MLSELLIVTAISCLIMFLFLKFETPKNFPPGPPRLPIVGHLPFLGQNSLAKMLQWNDSYGPIIGVWWGSYRSVVISDAKLMREAMNLQAFCGRPKIGIFTARSNGSLQGVGLRDDYHQWMEQRRFVLKNLRNFGFGTKSMEAKILDEVSELIEELKYSGGRALSKTVFDATIVGALWSIIFGGRLNRKDPEVVDALQRLLSFESKTTIDLFGIFFPWLNKLAPNLFGYNQLKREWSQATDFVRKNIKRHDQSTPKDESRDFVAAYSNHVKKTTDENSTFHPKHDEIVFTILDLLIAGTDTVNNFLQWFFAYAINFPEVQENLREEIDRVIGQERGPTLTDKPFMPYMEAVTTEVLRSAPPGPLSIFHNSSEDVEFNGYFIPKDTMITTNIYGCHHDAKVWGDPENFRPERFLDENGQFQKNENVIPFSVGKRACLGENVARDEIFLIVASLLQRFTIATPNGIKPNLEPHVGLALSVPPFEIAFTERL